MPCLSEISPNASTKVSGTVSIAYPVNKKGGRASPAAAPIRSGNNPVDMDVEGRLLEIAVPVRCLYSEREVLGGRWLKLSDREAADIEFTGNAFDQHSVMRRARRPRDGITRAEPADCRNPVREADVIGGVRPTRGFALGRPVCMRDRHAGDVYLPRRRAQPADEIPLLRRVGNVESGDLHGRRTVALG